MKSVLVIALPQAIYDFPGMKISLNPCSLRHNAHGFPLHFGYFHTARLLASVPEDGVLNSILKTAFQCKTPVRSGGGYR